MSLRRNLIDEIDFHEPDLADALSEALKDYEDTFPHVARGLRAASSFSWGFAAAYTQLKKEQSE